jgi:hypothetical protein
MSEFEKERGKCFGVDSVVTVALPADVSSIEILPHLPGMHHANEGYH